MDHSGIQDSKEGAGADALRQSRKSSEFRQTP